MEKFTIFAEEYGSYTFKSRGEFSQDGDSYTTTVFILEADGRLCLHVLKGKIWESGHTSEPIELTEQDFEDQSVLEQLCAELDAETARRKGVKELTPEVKVKAPIEDVISEDKITEGAGGAII